jgi:predicted nucleotidyltransferase
MNDHIYSKEELSQIVAPVARAYGVDRVYLFGSYARDEAGPGSDIDLRIDCGAISDLFALAAFYDELQEKVTVGLDVLTTGALDDEFLDRIKEEEVVLYGG